MGLLSSSSRAGGWGDKSYGKYRFVQITQRYIVTRSQDLARGNRIIVAATVDCKGDSGENGRGADGQSRGNRMRVFS